MATSIRVIQPNRFVQGTRTTQQTRQERPAQPMPSLAMTLRKLQQVADFAEKQGMNEAPFHQVVDQWRRRNPLLR